MTTIHLPIKLRDARYCTDCIACKIHSTSVHNKMPVTWWRAFCALYDEPIHGAMPDTDKFPRLPECIKDLGGD